MFMFIICPDYLAVGLLFSTCPVRDHMLTVQWLPLTTKIQVHTKSEAVNEELLDLYFQDAKNGGNDDVIMEHYEADRRCAIFECNEKEGMVRWLSIISILFC